MKRGGRIFMMVVFGVAIFTLVALITQLLWNWLVPTLFSGPFIGFWQAAGLLVLSKILFSGLGHKCHPGHRHGGYWKHRLYKKFSSMTPEEREEFKRKMREKWCVVDQRDPEKDSNV